MARRLDVVIGLMTRNPHRSFTKSLLQLYAYSCAKWPGWDNTVPKVHFKTATILPQGRQELVDDAIKAGATHLLFIDDDQSFPPHTLHQLVEHRKPVVAANVAIKRFPSAPTARKKMAESYGKPVFTYADDNRLERVWRIGCGVMLINLEVFEKMPRPYFGITWLEDEQRFEGEDWFLCRRLEALDIPIYIDHGISWEVGHWGECEFGHEMVLAAQLQAEMEAEQREQQKLIAVPNEPLIKVATI